MLYLNQDKRRAGVVNPDDYRGVAIPMRVSLFFLSAATLLFEINLTRLFSVAQFYHFAFMIVSLALLGFGAGGTVLSIFPNMTRKHPLDLLAWTGLGCAASMLIAYLLTNWIPFDSFTIAWDGNQALILALHYTALASPFFFSGLAVGALLAGAPARAGSTYAINLLGSAAGCLLALLVPTLLGGEGVVSLSTLMAAAAGMVAGFSRVFQRKSAWLKVPYFLAGGMLVVVTLTDISGRMLPGGSGLQLMETKISPYKGLSYARQYPGAEVTSTGWNAFSRVDVVSSNGIRSLPGLSYRYEGELPRQNGVLVDADDLKAVILPQNRDDYAAYLPGALAYDLRPQAEALVLEGGGGLDVLIGISQGASEITAVEPNPLVIGSAEHIYRHPQVVVYQETGRSFTRRTQQSYDVVVIALNSGYHPVSSGAYSLAEDYRYTVESFREALGVLKPDGILVVQRWLQIPPSEWLRAFALAVTALEEERLDPGQRITAYRGYNLGTLLIKKQPFTGNELSTVRDFARSRAYDMVFAPDISLQEVNQFNVLEEPYYYQAFTGLLAASLRSAWYDNFAYDVTPPNDDHPFFGHYFKWSQTGRILQEIGKTWQPFGGAGYFIVFLLLVISVGIALVIILLPLALFKRRDTSQNDTQPGIRAASLGYFGFIGLAFLLVEIPLIQRFILYLGYPALAMTAVLFSILFFSGIGSHFCRKYPLRRMLGLLVFATVGLNMVLPALFQSTLGFALALRLVITVLVIAPLGFLMGIPFAGGLSQLKTGDAVLIPWIWGVNGAASVVSSVLAALLALSAGFNLVFSIGSGCYLAAWWFSGRILKHRLPTGR